MSAADLLIRPLNVNAPLTAHDCHFHAGQLIANADGSYVARSNGSGALCVHFDGTPERAEFELSFADPNGLYGAVARRVVADSATRNVEMAFSPAPSVLSLERETQIVSLLTRPTPPLAAGEAVEVLSVSLSLKRDGLAPRALSASNLEIGSNLEFRVPSASLGGPGPIELSAEFTGSPSTRAARTVAHGTVTAQANLELAEPIAPSHPESGVRVRVKATSVAGPVPNGSVEARSAGASLGSARIANGSAELYLQLEESAAKAHPIELRYVPDSPWWLAGSTLSVTIPVLPPSPWRRIAWIAAVAALGTWLLLGWQRPRRLERAASSPAQRHAARAPVDVLEVGDADSGWRGRVLDAHDGTPIQNAVVLVRLPAFDSSGVLRTARTDASGAFELEGTAAGPGARSKCVLRFMRRSLRPCRRRASSSSRSRHGDALCLRVSWSGRCTMAAGSAAAKPPRVKSRAAPIARMWRVGQVQSMKRPSDPNRCPRRKSKPSSGANRGITESCRPTASAPEPLAYMDQLENVAQPIDDAKRAFL